MILSHLCSFESDPPKHRAEGCIRIGYEKAGFQPKILLKSNDLESLLMMVASEQGITVLPSYCVEKLNNAENLVYITLDGEEDYEDIYMMWKDGHNNAALQCFLDF